ncbi:anti-sigma regulatory factor [Acidicapsa ligni]|uniref:anti-sigma regulatory factor n=1 Tax=Acidicapsa ligni TaxID=542300 RepID=UPI0021E044C7|nr:anti-sigma regulatory factor [Acidicapsa ligni]
MGTIQKSETVPIKNGSDVVSVRQRVRSLAIEMKFGLVDQTKIVTAASELARNTLDYGNGGQVELSAIQDGIRTGLKLYFSDNGPGIPDVKLALSDGYTSGNGMGLGLGGSKRLMNEFEIDTAPGLGTRITCIRWK